MKISSAFFTPEDLLKTGLVDKNWIVVEKAFNKITPNAGIFVDKETNEIIFETKENSWTQIELIKNLGLDADHKISIQGGIESKDWNKLFDILIFHDCIGRNLLEDFRKALAEIIEINTVDKYQCTRLHWAAFRNDIGPMEILLKRNEANPNLRNKRGNTALHLAAFPYFAADTVEMLLDHDAEIDAIDILWRTPLMQAIRWGNYDSAHVLLRHRADPNLKDIEGQTALHCAAKFTDKIRLRKFTDKVDFIRLLLNHGAQINIVDNELKTPLKIAIAHRNWNVATILAVHQLHQFIKKFLKSKSTQILIIFSFLVIILAVFSFY